jgi:multiple sugar transport system substrate-binding protein
MQSLVARGFLADLTDLVDVDSVQETCLQHTIDGSSVDGRLYALPQSTSTAMMFYNVDLLEQANVDLPSADPEHRWTWEETVEAAKKAQAGGAKWGLMLDQVSRLYQFLPLPESLGGGNGVTGEDNLTPAITNDAWVEAAAFYGMLFSEGLAPRGIPGPQAADLFANGELAFFVAGPWQVLKFEPKEDLTYGVGAHPYFADGVPVTPTGSYSRGINPNSQYKEEALEYIKFETLTEEGALLSAQGQPLPPARKDALEVYLNDPIWHREYTQGSADLIRYELNNTARIRPPTAGYIEMEAVMGPALEDIANGADPAETLQRASEELEAAFDRVRDRLGG